jgi:hypothetical protein
VLVAHATTVRARNPLSQICVHDSVRGHKFGCPPPDAGGKGWRRALNCTLVIKSLRQALPQLLLNIDVEALIARLLARLRKPGAKELTRADRQAPRPRHDRVRIAGFHFAYKSAYLNGICPRGL